MTPRITLLSVLIPVCLEIFSQKPDSLRVSIHQAESEFYSTAGIPEPGVRLKETSTPSKLIMAGKEVLNRKVLGWHPYWASSSAYLSYDYKALSHLAYFSYEVDTATGGYTSIHEWNSTPIISYAHQRGTKVLLTVTNFGSPKNTKILSDTLKQKFLINSLISLLKSRNGDGVNFDLESVSSSQRSNLVKFITMAVTMIKSELPAAEISMASPAVDWSVSWDFKALSLLCDYLIVMGYDYYWSGSTTAGPVAPLEGENYSVSRTINTYISAGVKPEKLLLGVPWYGYDWPVVNSTRKAAATGSATARIFTAAEQLAEKNGRIFDYTTKVPWVNYSSSSVLRQLWYDDTESLGLKYNLVKNKNLGGIGVWALSYEGGRRDIWEKIISSFSDIDTTRNDFLRIYPNPVSETSTIEFFLLNKENVTLKIYDIRGNVRSVLFDGELDTGYHSIDFFAVGYESGIYICVLGSGSFVSTRKIVVTRH